MTESKSSGDGVPDGNDRVRAYRQAAQFARRRMEREAPLDAEALARVKASDIVVVPGAYDQVQLVLDALDLPYTTVAAGHLTACGLRPEQTLVVNCPGHLGGRAIPLVREFVRKGGTLFTTDWALRNVLEPAFPGYVEYNERATADDVVRIEVRDGDAAFLQGVLDEGDEPVWWLEGSSYPIRVLSPEKVMVLVSSQELASKYGEPAVAVTFTVGKGEVFHMISHYYLQRTELRSVRHKGAAASYVAAKGWDVDEEWGEKLAGMAAGDVESAYASSRLFANVVAAKKRKQSGSQARPA